MSDWQGHVTESQMLWATVEAGRLGRQSFGVTPSDAAKSQSFVEIVEIAGSFRRLKQKFGIAGSQEDHGCVLFGRSDGHEDLSHLLVLAQRVYRKDSNRWR